MKRRRTHGLGKFELGPRIEHGFGPVVLDPQDPHFVGCIRRSANTAEITAQTQVLLWFRELRRKHPDTTPRNLAILYDSDTAFKAISRNFPPKEHKAAAAIGQGLRKWLENDDVTVHFIWTKGHLADPGKTHKRTRTFVCAKGNKLADDLATTGQGPEPEGGYRHWELPEQFR